MAKKATKARSAKPKAKKAEQDGAPANAGYSAEILDIIATGDSFAPYSSRIIVRIKSDDPKGFTDLRLDHEPRTHRLALLAVATTAFSMRRMLDIIAPTRRNGAPDPDPLEGRIGQLSIGPPVSRKATAD